MTGETVNAAPPWVTAFFGETNGLRWSDIESGTAPDDWGPEVKGWLDILGRDEDAAALLPYMEANGTVVWYGVARSDRGARRLAEDLGGFVGASYGGFEARPYVPDAGDSPARALAEVFQAPLYRIAPAPHRMRSVRRVLAIYRVLLERRPSSGRLAARSVGALRTRFDRALLAGNEDEAARLYEEILATGRLSLENRHYLRVRLLAGLGKWTELAAEGPLLRQLADLHLPPQVRSELLDALYRTHIDPVEDPRSASAAVDEFRRKLSPYGRLFATRQDVRQPRVVKAFLMNALLRDPPQREELEALAALLPMSAEDAPFSGALRVLVEQRLPPPKLPGVDEADAAFDDMDYDLALGLYAAISPTRKSVARMLQCANTIKTTAAAITALAALARVPDTEAALPQSLRTIVTELRALPGTAEASTAPADGTIMESTTFEPDDWYDWAKWLGAGASSKQALEILEQRCGNWSIESHLQRHAAEELAQQIGNAALADGETVQKAFPHLFRAFVGETEEPRPTLAPVYAALLTALVLAPSRTGDDLELARTLASLLLETGLSDTDYKNLIRDLTDLFRQDASVSTLDWALDLAELVATCRSASPSDQLNLVVAVLEFARGRIHRLTGRQIEIVRALCADIGIAPDPYLVGAPSEDPDAGVLAQLADRSIAIYTLAETAGQRALQILAKLVPGIDVALNSDKVCTDRLAALARNSELFVFAWRSSKHAAYYCIKDHRPKEMGILMPQGKGTASIVRALLEA